jgi:purine-nucleoside phosphorylase
VTERDRLSEAADRLREWLGPRRPVIGLVLGSGLGVLSEALDRPARLSFGEIPGFAESAVPGHAGELIVGRFAGREVLCQSGRFHGYEGHDLNAVALPVRVFARLGAVALVLTNAAGGIRRGLGPGTLMLIRDQLNLTFGNPLVGGVLPEDERFPDMSAPYDPMLGALTREVAITARIPLEEGVYAGVAGPSYETCAEIRMLRRFGADAVGMSTVHEVIAARARGLRCLGISMITNRAAGLSGAPLSHDDVMRSARGAAETLGRLLTGIIQRLPV